MVFIPEESLFIVDYLLHDGAIDKPGCRALLHREPQLRCWYEGPAFQCTSAAEEIRRMHEYSAQRHGARVWGQKTPRFIRHRALIDDKLGPCRWILVYRDPRAVCASMRLSGQHSNSVVRSCARWKRDNADIVSMLAQSERKPPDVFLLKYENLVSDYESVLESVLSFCGLPAVEMHDLFDNVRPTSFGTSTFENNAIRDTVIPDERYLHAWKSALDPREIAYIEEHCSREMETMGYRRSGLAVDESFRIRDLVAKTKDLGIIYRYFRHWPSYPIHFMIRKLFFLAVR